mmetsp:Transcript_20348/g.34667  ORF Transcript_20348/g.34667 Transcript_20348/m.34667 type:complete len:353 (+) Transcript_20348:58-1116(+)
MARESIRLREEATHTKIEVASAVITYCLCSGGMLLVNKITVHHFPLPALVTLCQFSCASVFVYGGKLLGCLSMDDFEWERAKYFIVYVLSFTLGTYTNMKVLSMANVETVIVFRSCTPMAVCVTDYLFYNRSLPGARSSFSLLLVAIGAACYILTDREFQVNGASAYTWVMIWWVVLVFQLTYGKFIAAGMKHKSLWTPVLYTNTFSVIPALTVGLIAGELSHARLVSVFAQATSTGYIWLAVSCLIGISISWAGFWCQTVVTATAYSVVGVMNKMLTVTVNVLIWDKHASTAGIASLVLCLFGGSLYQQAPMRAMPKDIDSETTALKPIQEAGAEVRESDEESAFPTTSKK